MLVPQEVLEITSSNGYETTVLENSTVTFTCHVSKKKQDLRIAWYKDNTTLSSYRVNNVSFSKKFSKHDKGKYECVAFAAGYRKSINIFVIANESFYENFTNNTDFETTTYSDETTGNFI